ncbi:FAD-binding protein, partial [Thermus scotoductus]|uniref:FAD-binding protein n=1 Tax=Thermus scotoductus TaxID=37636 RepID=UPI000F80DC6D
MLAGQAHQGLYLFPGFRQDHRQRLWPHQNGAILVGPEPLAVVLPETREEVQALVRLARKHGLSLVARGAGSGLSGGAVPEEGAIVVAFTRLARLELDPVGRTAPALI